MNMSYKTALEVMAVLERFPTLKGSFMIVNNEGEPIECDPEDKEKEEDGEH